MWIGGWDNNVLLVPIQHTHIPLAASEWQSSWQCCSEWWSWAVHHWSPSAHTMGCILRASVITRTGNIHACKAAKCRHIAHKLLKIQYMYNYINHNMYTNKLPITQIFNRHSHTAIIISLTFDSPFITGMRKRTSFPLLSYSPLVYRTTSWGGISAEHTTCSWFVNTVCMW